MQGRRGPTQDRGRVLSQRSKQRFFIEGLLREEVEIHGAPVTEAQCESGPAGKVEAGRERCRTQAQKEVLRRRRYRLRMPAAEFFHQGAARAATSSRGRPYTRDQKFADLRVRRRSRRMTSLISGSEKTSLSQA